MNDMTNTRAKSPLLDHCPPSLSASWYVDQAQFNTERKKIHANTWIYVGRVRAVEPMSMHRVSVAGENLILLKNANGEISCFHNVCRHRGAELCTANELRLKSKLIVCPYHEWAYDLQGQLVRTPYATPTPDFVRADHGLLKVHTKLWNGFVFVCLAETPPDFEAAPDMGPHALDNWPLADLVVGHVLVEEMACNWKIFWENYNECLHCPGIHPELCDMVPVYKQGIMSRHEVQEGQLSPSSESDLKPGAQTWSVDGQLCGPEFPNLTAEERARGHTFVTLWPTMYVVAHRDYVRAVSLRPLSAERTELRTEWLFAPETLNEPGFDLDNVTRFASLVMRQDAAACELNQRGLRSTAFKGGRLMPQEFDVYRFQQWVRKYLA